MKRGSVSYVVLLVILLSVLTPSIFAVGGGGGGDGGGGGGDSGGSGSSSSSSGSAVPIFSAVDCKDDGSISFTMKNSQDLINALNEDNNQTAIVPGRWISPTKFESEEAIFLIPGNYSITNENGIKREFECPGLKFACSLLTIKDLYCIENSSGVIAGLIIQNEDSISNLKFNFKIATEIGEKIVSYEKGSFNTELKDLKINKKNSSLILTLSNRLNAQNFEVLHPKCIGKKYVYSSVECSDSLKLAKKGIDSDKLKCGGLISLKDRVRCRINLETEQDEYQNFFPEECRNHKNPSKCLQVYRSVSECWDSEKSRERIDCLKEKINLKDIKQEEKNCQSTQSTQCKKELNEKVLTLIKLRFYNLEEQAEILEEKGLLEEEDLINFVSEIEMKKLKFNEAKNKEEMKAVIAEVRELWTQLMKSLKKE